MSRLPLLKRYPNGARVYRTDFDTDDNCQDELATVIGYDLTREVYHVYIDDSSPYSGHDYWPCRATKLAAIQPWNESGVEVEPGEQWVVSRSRGLEVIRGEIARILSLPNGSGEVLVEVRFTVSVEDLDYPVGD